MSVLRLQILIWKSLFLNDDTATILRTEVTRMKIRVGVYSQNEMLSPSVNFIRFVKNIEMFNPAAIERNRDCILKNIIFCIRDDKSRKNIIIFDCLTNKEL